MSFDVDIPEFKFEFPQTQGKLKALGVLIDLEDLRKNIRFSEVGDEIIEINGKEEYEYLLSQNRIIPMHGFYWMRRENEQGYSEYQPGYLYLSEYYLKDYGKPRAHITHCEKLKEIGKERYSWASSLSVSVLDKSFSGLPPHHARHYRNYKQVEISDLPVCKFCIQEVLSRHETTKDLLEDESYFRRYESSYLTPDGYTFNWKFLSRKFRESKNYTCEKCNFFPDPNHPQEKACIHVHHINGDKLDNEVRNLQCLCAVCHAETDERHAANLKNSNEYKYLRQKRKSYDSQVVFLMNPVPSTGIG